MKIIKDSLLIHKGFSFVELMVVIAIIVVLAGIFIPTYFKHIDDAKKEGSITNCCNVVKAAKVLETEKEIEFEVPYTEVKKLSKADGVINEIRESENGITYVKYTGKYVVIYENGKYRVEE